MKLILIYEFFQSNEKEIAPTIEKIIKNMSNSAELNIRADLKEVKIKVKED